MELVGKEMEMGVPTTQVYGYEILEDHYVDMTRKAQGEQGTLMVNVEAAPTFQLARL